MPHVALAGTNAKRHIRAQGDESGAAGNATCTLSRRHLDPRFAP